MPKTTPRHVLRELAATAQADERTVKAVLDGRIVRGAVDMRIRHAISQREVSRQVDALAISTTPKTTA